MISKRIGTITGLLPTWAIAVIALALVSCGGGQQIEKFVPVRVIAFGDELSVIEANGDKYTNNYRLDANTPRDCTQNPIWVQGLANAFGLFFPQCPSTSTSTPSRIFAVAGAKTEDVKTQIDLFAATGTFGNKDLVTILAGENDILEQYAAIDAGTITEDTAGAVLDQRGIDLAAQVNRVALAGGRVLIATAPDMGLTPFALKEKAAKTDVDRAALLSRLTVRFNAKLRINLINDGHLIGLLLFDELIQSIAKTTGWVVDTAACDAQHVSPLTLCDSTTMVSDTRSTPAVPASGSSWLWADDLHVSSGGHSSLASLALSRATGNPF
jgi:phospholipase/lecithinase/hemolysin